MCFLFCLDSSMITHCQWNNPETCGYNCPLHDDVIKWKHFPRYWPFVRGIHRSPVNSPHKGQWRGALMFSLISAWINRWVNNRVAGDLRRHPAHYDVIVMETMANINQVKTVYIVSEMYCSMLWHTDFDLKTFICGCLQYKQQHCYAINKDMEYKYCHESPIKI